MARGFWGSDKFAGLPSLSVAAHELKTPITLMRQLSLVLQDESLSDDQKQYYHRQLIAVADGALRLTADLAQAANLQPSLFPLEPINPLALCRDVAQQMGPVVGLYGRSVQWPKTSRRTVLAVANRQLLSRIITNFVDNALKYTEADMPISVLVRQRAGLVRIAVRDYGPQLTRHEYKSLLSEMGQAKSVKTRPESSGLGIFIASEFARAMSGDIGLIRHRDGLTFYVELPLSKQLSWL